MNAITKKAVSSYVQFKKENNQWVAYWRGTLNRIKVKNGSLVAGFNTQGDLRLFLLKTDTPLEYGVIIDVIKPITERQRVINESRF